METFLAIYSISGLLFIGYVIGVFVLSRHYQNKTKEIQKTTTYYIGKAMGVIK